ncbi:uncharacterized protein LOC108674746 [Hyalella azteca]|uniref:Uncharacterized protein LOC108674746 n=1 Tax=Hyalella azteca TaxID=294128 RepID=A0A979FST7_HYAAZ|nr:uncharacterized protein LOC108674746 [Hyalella azteca]
MLSVLAKSVGQDLFWLQWIDIFVHLPLGSVSTTASIVTLMAVTLERLLVIRQPIRSRRWRTTRIANKICVGIVVFSVVFNAPYFFSYRIDDGVIVRTEFSASGYYNVHNWLRLILLAITPGVFLLVGNLLFILSLSSFGQNFSRGTESGDASNSPPVSNFQNSSPEPESRIKKAQSPTLGNIPNEGQVAIFQTGGQRRSTLASLSNTEIMVHIRLLQREHVSDDHDGKCSGHEDEYRQSVTINFRKIKFCEKCKKIQKENVAQNFVFGTCTCDIKRSISLPSCFVQMKHDCLDDVRKEKNKNFLMSPRSSFFASSKRRSKQRRSERHTSNTTLGEQASQAHMVLQTPGDDPDVAALLSKLLPLPGPEQTLQQATTSHVRRLDQRPKL